MKVHTELLLGKTDPGLREPEVHLDIAKVFGSAAQIESLGFDGVIANETRDDPFLLLALAAQATERLELATSVAIAFPRAPAITAMTAWQLQALSGGRFTLGLGSQVRAHIVRRFGLPASPLGSWMRDYIGAVRAIWACWQNGTPLQFESEHYQLDLMSSLFTPGPLEFPDIPIHLAALNPYMCRVAGEVADGLRPHPVCTPRYIKEVMQPAVALGAQRAGRDPKQLVVAMRPLVATAPDEESLQNKISEVRARVAFYASTPAYRPAFDIWGLDGLARGLSVLAREQRWEEMPGRIDDDVLNTFAVVGTYDQMAEKIVQRYGDVLTHVGFSIPVENEQEAQLLKGILQRIQQA